MKSRLIQKNILSLVLSLVVFAVVLGLSFGSFCAAPPVQQTGETYEPDCFPPSIMPVYFLQGTDYEMGYQYGEQAAPYLAAFRDYMHANWCGYEPTNTREKAEIMLKGYEYAVEKYTPYMKEMMKGMAAGMTDAGYPTSYGEVLLMQVLWEWNRLDPADPEHNYPKEAKDNDIDIVLPWDNFFPETDLCNTLGSLGEEDSQMGCSTFAGWGKQTTEGQLVYGETSDGGNDKHDLVLVFFPETGNNFVTMTEAGNIAGNYNMNSKGVCTSATYLGSVRSVDYQWGLPFPIFQYHMSVFGNTAAEQKDMHLSIQKSLGMNYVTVDPQEAFVIEGTAAVQRIRTSGDYGESGNFIVNTNHARSPEMIEFLGRDGRDCARYAFLFDTMKNNEGQLDVEFGKMLWRNKPVLRTSNRMAGVGTTNGTDTFISYFCTGSAYKIAKALPIDPSYSYFQLDLQETPAGVVAKAIKSSEKSISKAMAEFNKLEYTDPRYSRLDDILKRARTHWRTGINHERHAKISKGREALYSYSKAMTAYAQVECVLCRYTMNLLPLHSNRKT